MKYYKIKINGFYGDGFIASEANGERVKDGSLYFDRLSSGEIVENAPIFDYFFLESYDKKKHWEWAIFDVHRFWLNTNLVGSWLVSSDLKLMLGTFNLPNPHHFYPSKLKYKESKLDYYIYQFAGDTMADSVLSKYIVWPETTYLNQKTETVFKVTSFEDLMLRFRAIYKESKILPVPSKITLNDSLDFLPLARYFNSDIVSEKLKIAIEEMKITGFNFEELNYEVEVRN